MPVSCFVLPDGSPIAAEKVDAGARALREHQMAGRITVPWERVPNAQRRKWREATLIVLGAADAA